MENQQLEIVRLTELETVIKRGQQTFIEVGLALAEIRDSRLYKQEFATFEDYCLERWGWSASRSRRLISSAEAVASMQSVPIGTLSKVQNEGQARELAKIKDPEIRAQVWQQVNEVASEIETVVTAKFVKEAVEVQKQIELQESVNGFPVSDDFPVVAEMVANVSAESKESPGYKWRESLNRTITMLNSIKDIGGIGKLTQNWSLEQKIHYAERCREHAETLNEYAEELQKTI